MESKYVKLYNKHGREVQVLATDAAEYKKIHGFRETPDQVVDMLRLPVFPAGSSVQLRNKHGRDVFVAASDVREQIETHGFSFPPGPYKVIKDGKALDFGAREGVDEDPGADLGDDPGDDLGDDLGDDPGDDPGDEEKQGASDGSTYPEGSPGPTWTKDQLIAYGDAHGIALSGRMTKDEMLVEIATAP